ncbi:MAG: CHAT domain-containing protein, partial [bacterium]|nr:CHAT domain-containing protein [bacterium]
DPAGDVVLTVDGPIDDYGFEHVCFVAKDRGPHRLRVRAWVEDAAGPYSIRLVAQRPATPRDRACTAATRAFAAAEQQRQETGKASEELLAAYERALELWRRADEPYPLAVTLKQTGLVFSGLGDLQAEIRCYEEALALLHRTGDPRQEVAVLNLRGLVYRRLGDPDLARSSFEEALGIAHVRFCAARVERGDQHPEAALRSIEEALALVDALRSSALRQGHRFPALALWQDYSELYVELLMMLHEREPGAGYDARAFEVSDLARARRLYQMLLESRVDVRSGVPEELLERERATHGLLDEVHPELSGVVLSLFDEHGRRRDGHLRLHEIYALQLPADLVVLSACRTALG